jgi:DNA invertase Pin-like site-specific DNA recombinase
MNIVALYARVSKDICRTCGKQPGSHDGADHEFKGQDPEAQLQPLREMCRMRGWTIAREFVDQGWSGASESRPAFDELMAAIAATDAKKPDTRKFDGVVVWKFDRFFRSTKHMLQVLDTFEAKRLEFVSLTESIDTSSPIGRLLFTILAAIAEFERNLIAERIRNGMKKEGAKRPGPKIGEDGPSRSTLWRRNRAVART